MPERTSATGEATREALAGWRALLGLSRPATWAATAVPFAVAFLEAERGWSAGLILGTLYFTVPFGLLRHGIRAISDPSGYRQGAAGGLGSDTIRLAIAITGLPLLATLVLIGGAPAGLGLAAAVGVAVGLAWTPLRSSERPVIDLGGEAIVVVLVALVGWLLGASGAGTTTDPGPPWPMLVALGAWSLGLVALAAVRDATSPAPSHGMGSAVDPAGRATGTIGAIGPRATAGVALVGAAVATATLVLTGGLGILGGVGVATFLLPPLMVLAAPTAGIGAAATRASSTSRDLMPLVGGWLGILLAQHWGITSWDPWAVAIVVPAAVAGIVLVGTIATRLATRRRRVPASLGVAAAEDPSVTIIVPCRDAMVHLPVTLASLRSQTYADSTVLVVDDDSTDGSIAEAAAWLGEDAVVAAPPRPLGWTSRDWACHVGAAQVDTDLLLFVDQGTSLAPVATRILVEQMRAGRLDLLSGVTRHAMPTSGERAGVPSFPLVLFGFMPIWWSAVTSGRPPGLAFAHDSFVLVRRAAYVDAGGHDADPSGPGDARSLARRIAAGGGRVGTVHAARLGATRGDPEPDAAVRRWRRGFVAGLGGRLAVAIPVIAAEVAAFVAPFILPPVALLADAGPDLVGASCVPLVILLVARVAIVATQHHPLTTIVWHPVTVGLMLAGQVASMVDLITGAGRQATAGAADPGGASDGR